MKSVAKRVDQQLFHARDQFRGALAEDSARLLGKVLDRIAAVAEDVMIEVRAPRLQFVRRQVPQGDDGMIERVERRQVRRIGLAPPEIDQASEILKRADVVPPQSWDVDRVSRTEFGPKRRFER